MPDSPTSAAPDAPRRLADHQVLALHGPDAVRFAQAQFMSDVAALADGQWQWSGWLTPKGRVVALFALLRLDAERLWLVLPDVAAEALAAQLKRFVFRSKVVVEARPELVVSGSFKASGTAQGAASAMGDDGSVALDLSGDGGSRTLVISTAPAVEDPDAQAAWRSFDIAHGLPRLDAAQADRWTPQQLSLERLRAFSVKKGCYPGQEIVARTHFLGKAKRELVLLAADVAFAVGEDDVVSVAAHGGQHCALAVRAMEREPDPRERPLLEGLAR